jgi:hypothetical protein
VQHLKNIGGKVNVNNNFTYTVRLMSYIITQSDHSVIEDLKEIDVMVEDNWPGKTKVFASHEEAEIYLINDGIYPHGGVFPFNIRIQRVQ